MTYTDKIKRPPRFCNKYRKSDPDAECKCDECIQDMKTRAEVNNFLLNPNTK